MQWRHDLYRLRQLRSKWSARRIELRRRYEQGKAELIEHVNAYFFAGGK